MQILDANHLHTVAVLILVTLSTAACPDPNSVDASVRDASVRDASVRDASVADAHVTDHAVSDRVPTDLYHVDRQQSDDGADATGMDVGAIDQATRDQTGADADLDVDAHTADARNPEAGVTIWLADAEDAVTAYLIDANEGAYNLFWGATVYLGRHWDTAHVSYTTALRFDTVPIPAGAIIDQASLEISPANDVDANHNLWINIYAELSANSVPFVVDDYESGRPDQRARSSAKIDHWLLRCNDDCTDLTEYDCPQRQRDCWLAETRYQCPKDLRTLVQEVIDLPDWHSGNALTLLLVNAAIDEDGVDYQSSRGFSGVDPTRSSEHRPKLVLHYHLP